MFRTVGVLDTALLKELSGFLVGRKRRRLLFWVGAGFACWGIIGLWRRYYFGTVLSVIAIGIFVVEYLLIKRQMVRLNQRRRDELSPSSEPRQVAIWFDQDGVKLSAEGEGEPQVLRYENFHDFTETAHLYALKTESRLIVTVFKDQLNEEQRGEFKEFLRGQPTKIKPRRIR